MGGFHQHGLTAAISKQPKLLDMANELIHTSTLCTFFDPLVISVAAVLCEVYTWINLEVLLFSPLQLFVGLSFPYEGPAPLEAIANGCAFLNPKFNPPKSSKNTDFFKGKPTLREVSVSPLLDRQPLKAGFVFPNLHSLRSWPLNTPTLRCTSVNPTCGRWI